ncbi:MAG: integrase [Solibacterales bacterium]|nr:integrase [Bryobacterales bacterium]|tara:strand:+ start:188626 stop:189831 length:1206 start_codon:yes stop_codon:yes gene_type:complete
MAHRKGQQLTARTVESLKEPGRYGDGQRTGLWFRVTERGNKSWIFRFMRYGRAREMGLGSYPAVTLADARDLVLGARRLLLKDIDPIEDRKRLKAEGLTATRGINFAEAARQYVNGHKAEWSNAKHAWQWTATLENYANPVLGELDVASITPDAVADVLRPLWEDKQETASRLRGRIERVLDWCIVKKYLSGENPARWKANLDHLLPKRPKVRVRHYPALPWGDLPAFMKRLQSVEGLGARALEFAILTAARSGEVRGATWEEVDLSAAVWTIPGERMKAGKEHRVPLSDVALELLEALPRLKGSPWVFVAPRGGMLSDMTLSAVCRRLEVKAVPHGFRSTFRDWAAETTNYPREVVEQALAHINPNKVEAAYLRSDLFDRRRSLMKEWTNFCWDKVVSDG